MNFNLKLVGILFIVVLFIAIIYILRKGRVSVKYSIVWFLASLVLLLFILFPELLGWLTKLLGFEMGANMVFAGLIALLMFINIVLTVIVSGQNEKIRLLVQEVSLLKGKIK